MRLRSTDPAKTSHIPLEAISSGHAPLSWEALRSARMVISSSLDRRSAAAMLTQARPAMQDSRSL
jgi:hypothetical protein